MASIIYNSCLYGVFRSMIHFDTDDFKVLLVTSDYIPDKDKHKTRFDVIGYEISDGGGYIRGGLPAKAAIISNTSNDRIDVQLNGVTWEPANITANGAIYYRVRGVPQNDDLICYVQFSKEASAIDGEFAITPSI